MYTYVPCLLVSCLNILHALIFRSNIQLNYEAIFFYIMTFYVLGIWCILHFNTNLSKHAVYS